MSRIFILTGWFLVSLLFKISSKYSFSFAIIFIGLSGLSMIFGREGFAVRLLTYSYGFLFIGVLSYFREVKNK